MTTPETIENPKGRAAGRTEGSQQRVVRRGRANATQAGLQAAVQWIGWCKNNGWDEQTLPALEALWWKHHDENGNLKAPNDRTMARRVESTTI